MPKHATKLPSRPRLDGSLDIKLNPVHLPDGTIVAWAEAFPSSIASYVRREPRED